MAYCTKKATVNYSFGNSGSNRTFSTELAPIDIDISERYTPPFAAGQCPTQYWVSYWVKYRYERAPNDIVTWYFYDEPTGIPVYGKILDVYMPYKIGEPCGGKNAVRGATIYYFDYRLQQVRTTGANPRTVVPASDSYPYNDTWTLYDWGGVAIKPVDGVSNNCGNPKPICTFKVLKNGNPIFIDKGDCPISFSVVCDDECPPNHLKCSSPGYPGYCCIPCSEIAGELRSITGQVRSVNNG